MAHQRNMFPIEFTHYAPDQADAIPEEKILHPFWVMRRPSMTCLKTRNFHELIVER